MRSPALALAWQLWRPHRWGFCAIGAGLAVLATLCRILPAASSKSLGPLTGLLVFWALIYLLSVFVYSDLSPGAKHAGFPARMFTLPVRTSVLVAWPMFYGMATVALLWLAAAWLVLVPCGLSPAHGWWPALLCAACVACFQAIAWTLVGSPLARLVVAVLVLPGWVLAGVHSAFFTSLNGLVTGLVGAIAASYVVAVAGVGRDRRGGTPLVVWLLRRLDGIMSRLPRRRSSFPSSARAQLWCEWREKGLVLPLLLGCFMLVLLLSIPATEFDALLLLRVLAAVLVLPLVLASFVGFGMGKTSFWAKDLGLSPFAATRPLSSGTLALAKLRTAALSAAAGWAVMLLLTVLWVVLSGSWGQVAKWWGLFCQGRGAVEIWAVVPLALVGAIGQTWAQLAAGLSTALTGRAWVVNGVTLLSLVVVAALTTAGVWTASHPDFLDTLVGVLWGVAAVALPAKLLAAWSVVRALLRQRLLEATVVAGLLGVWVVTAGCLVGLNYLLIPDAVAPIHLLAAGIVLGLPLVRPLAAPLALAWNRHR